MEQRPASEWIRIPDAHEALIARQDFELVQRIKGLDITQESVGDKCSVLSRRSCPTSFIFRCRI